MSDISIKRSESGNWVVRSGTEKISVHPPHSWQAAFQSASEHGVSRIGDSGVMSA